MGCEDGVKVLEGLFGGAVWSAWGGGWGEGVRGMGVVPAR